MDDEDWSPEPVEPVSDFFEAWTLRLPPASAGFELASLAGGFALGAAGFEPPASPDPVADWLAGSGAGVASGRSAALVPFLAFAAVVFVSDRPLCSAFVADSFGFEPISWPLSEPASEEGGFGLDLDLGLERALGFGLGFASASFLDPDGLSVFTALSDGSAFPLRSGLA